MNVTVVGGGVIGYAVAYELASRGARVRVVDMRGPGAGATQASAGMLAPYIEGHHPALLELTLGSLSLYDAFIVRVQASAQRRVEYGRTGTLNAASSDRCEGHLKTLAAQLTDAGVEHAMLDGRAARAAEPGLASGVRSALVIPEHGYVKVADLMAALVAAAAGAGVESAIGRVEAIEPARGGVVVRTAATGFKSDAVVIASGSWSGELPSPAAPVKPIRGQLLQMQFPAPPISRVVWGEGCYMVPWRDGSVLVGATSEDVGFDESSTAAGVAQLEAAACALLPSVAQAVRSAVRVGLRPATTDELPLIGRSSTMPGVFYATGHYRNGVLLAPLTAMLLADLVMEGREAPLLELVRPDRLGV